MMGDAVTVQSTNLRTVAYDAEGQILRVTFANGGTYDYHGVPAAERDALVGAASPGAYLASRIKGHYAAIKV